MNSDEQSHRSLVVCKAWNGLAHVPAARLVPDFIVPFCSKESRPGQPLFDQVGPQTFECTEDLLASIVLTLSRFEELQPIEKDEHGRFPASASLAKAHGFLNRPIVDEYGLGFQQILLRLTPGWNPEPAKLRIKVTHDVDQLGIPFSLRSALGHLLLRRAPLACARDFLSLALPVEPGYLNFVRAICRHSLDRNICPAVYWKASPPGPFDTGYDLNDPRVANVITWCRERGIELGVHPSYDTFESPTKLQQEVEHVRNVVGYKHIGGRQHYLRWCPRTWVEWEGCGLAYDSSVGYADHVGFRAGTCFPYFPWLLESDRQSALLEIPLIVMDGTLIGYMKLDLEESLQIVQKLVRSCALVGGVFTLLWHNSSLVGTDAQLYLRILDYLAGESDYDWEADIRLLRGEPRPRYMS